MKKHRKNLHRHSLSWFHKRIGKKIYRARTSCQCNTCYRAFVDGVFVHDSIHGDYLKLCQDEMGIRYSERPIK
jgi:hypothetical protein